MANLVDLAQPAVANLLQSDEDQLYEALGMRLIAMQSDPALGGSFEPDITYDAKVMGPADDLRDFGQRFFKRMSRQAYSIACSNTDDNRNERKQLADALHFGPEAVAAALAAILVAHFAIAASIAAVIASLAVKLFYDAAGKTLCEMWREKLPTKNE